MTNNQGILKLADKIGLFLLVGSLLSYFLFTLPFDFSVTCSSVNEGIHFVNAQLLLNGKHLYTEILQVRGPLLFLFYAAVLKIFGFGTWSIIAIHVLHKVIIILIGVAIYFIAEKLFESKFFAGLSVLFWILIEITPIGLWGQHFEIESTFALEAEYFCALFSLWSIYCLLEACSTNTNKRKGDFLSLLSGFLATCSIMFKPTGAVVAIAVFCWLIYLVFFQRKSIHTQKHNFIFFFVGLFVSLVISLIAIYMHNRDLNSFWYVYFQYGQYKDRNIISVEFFISKIFQFMTRYSRSWSNFVLFLFAFLCFGWGLVRSFFIKTNDNVLKSFSSLISIWGIGNICTAITPGIYGSYYYLLIWPSVAISLVFGLKDLYTHSKLFNRKYFKLTVTIFISMFFIQRLCTIFPVFLQIEKEQLDLNFIYQVESFQDKVKPNGQVLNPKRVLYLLVADIVNGYLPDKTDTFYVLNFVKGGFTFSPFIYIYAKRQSPTSIVSDTLHFEKFLNKILPILWRDFNSTPPKIIIVPNPIYCKAEKRYLLNSFFTDFSYFLKQNYHKKDTFRIENKFENRIDACDVYERN